MPTRGSPGSALPGILDLPEFPKGEADEEPGEGGEDAGQGKGEREQKTPENAGDLDPPVQPALACGLPECTRVRDRVVDQHRTAREPDEDGWIQKDDREHGDDRDCDLGGDRSVRTDGDPVEVGRQVPVPCHCEAGAAESGEDSDQRTEARDRGNDRDSGDRDIRAEQRSER